MHGFGPPVPQAGVVGDLYVDKSTFNMFNKRAPLDVDPWGHYLFTLPAPYNTTSTRWFGPVPPTNDLGTDGDYFMLWAGSGSYGMQPIMYGPKTAGAWPTPGVQITPTLNPLYTADDQHDI